MFETPQMRQSSRAPMAQDDDSLTTTFQELDALERRGRSAGGGRHRLADDAAGAQADRGPKRHLWTRGTIVIGLATAVLWAWPYVVKSIW